MTLTPGARIATYEVLRPLGAGGMGEVYEARRVVPAKLPLPPIPDLMTITPDNRLLIYGGNRSESDIWVAELRRER